MPESTPQTGRLVFRDPPPVSAAQKRIPADAVAFRDVAEDQGRRHAIDAGWIGNDDTTELIRSVSWYHTIELPGGAVTPGQFDHRTLLPRYGLPEDMTGMRALDVATFNGYWAFEMERRGATVTAVDLDDPHEWDFPHLARPLVAQMRGMAPIGQGFAIASNALGSKVERLGVSVYQLDPEQLGMFDFVHCGDLLVHLRDPLTALERIRAVTRGQMLLSDGIDIDAVPGRFGPTTQYLGGWNDVVWWVPSIESLTQMIVDAGFSTVHINAIYNLAKTYETDGFWRASITANA